MRLSRREWLRASGAVLVSYPAWAAQENTIGEDLTQEVRRWNARSPVPNFRPGNVIVQRVRKPVAARRDGFIVAVSPGQTLPTPLVVNNRVYVGGGFGSHEFCCLDAENGNVLWTAQLSDNGPGPAAYYDGAIYVNTESCTLFSLNALTGQPLWSRWLGDPLPTMPAVANGRVFTAYPGRGVGSLLDGNRRVLACLDAKTGRPIWLRWIDSEILSAPVADKDYIYVATFGGVLYRFRQSDGAVLLAVKSRPTSAPVLVDKYVLYSRVRSNSNSETVVGHANSSNQLLLETVHSGRRAWPLDSDANAAYVYQGSRPLVWGGRMFVSLGEEVYCLGLVHGMPYWSRKVGQALPPVAAGKAVIVAARQGEILRLDIGTGEVLAKYDLREPVSFPPVVHDGNIYVGTAQGNLVCIKTGDRQLTGWPCWGGSAHRNNTA